MNANSRINLIIFFVLKKYNAPKILEMISWCIVVNLAPALGISELHFFVYLQLILIMSEYVS